MVRRFVTCESRRDAKRRLSLSATNASSNMESELLSHLFMEDRLGLGTSIERVLVLRSGDFVGDAKASTLVSGKLAAVP